MSRPVKIKEWTLLLILAAASILLWHRFAYPKFAFINFSIDRSEAIEIARTTLKTFEPHADEYLTSAVFLRESGADRYLQKTLGFDGLLQFIRSNNYDMFNWDVRFFKEGEEEEYRFSISASSGEVTAFVHKVSDTYATKTIPKEILLSRAIQFLNDRFGFLLKDYEQKTDLSKTLAKRKEYLFSWDKKGVEIPWSDDLQANKAHLAIKIQVSGEKILSFSKNILRIPGDFKRDINIRTITGQNLMAVMRAFYFLLFLAAVFYIVSRSSHLATHCTRPFYMRIFIFCVFLTIIDNINSIQHILFQYNTTSSLNSFIYRNSLQKMMGAIFLSAAMIIPALAGESLRLETRRKDPDASFLHYIYSSFFTRHIAKLIILGYFVTIIMFGLQSSLFEFGQNHLGVWLEQTWRTQFRTSHWPFLTAFTHSFQTSLLEEFIYRLFAIHFFTKIFKRTWVAILISSVLWGFAHTSYPIFPMWFRGLEMTVIGIFMGIMYVRFGLIPVLVGHFLFNMFWHTVGFIIGEAGAFDFYTSLAALSLPLLWAMLAFILNRSDKERPLSWILNPAQKFNVEVLQSYLKAHSAEYAQKDSEKLKKEITGKGWDYAVVDKAVDEYKENLNSSE